MLRTVAERLTMIHKNLINLKIPTWITITH